MRATPSGHIDASACGYYWLLEAFTDEVLGRGGVYADKVIERTTLSAWEAHWFTTKEEAERFLDQAPTAEGRVWRATEHGFYGG